MLSSLLTYNKVARIYILTEGLTNENRDLILSELNEFDTEINFVKIDLNDIRDFPMPEEDYLQHISLATYYRLLIGEILPLNEDRIIYLDCDIVINGSIKELWDTNLLNKTIGAVCHLESNNNCLRLGINENTGYFNAGVLLIDLKLWREKHTGIKLLKYISKNRHIIRYHDQDVLNAVLYNDCQHLSPKWNFSTEHSNPLVKRIIRHESSIPDDKKDALIKEIKHLRKHPVIIHYLDKPKPWDKKCFSIHQYLYYQAAKRTRHYRHLKYDAIDNTISRLRYIVYIYIMSLLKRRQPL